MMRPDKTRIYPRRAMVFGLLGLMVTGCDVPAPAVLDPSTPSGTPPALMTSVPSDRAAIVFLRGREFAASANAWRVSVNGTPVADLDIGMRHRQVVPAGAVEVKAEVVPTIMNFGLGLAMMEKPVLTFNAQAGRVYAIELDPAFAGGPAFKRRGTDALQEAASYVDAPLPAR